MPSLALPDLHAVPDRVLRLRCAPGWCLAPGWASSLRDYDLWYVWGGAGRMTTEAGSFDLKPGVGFWMRPGGRYEATQDPRRRLGVSAIHFSLASGRRRLGPAAFTPPFEAFESPHPAYVEEVMTRIVDLCHAGDRVTAGFLLKALLLDLAGAKKHGEPPLLRHHRERLDGVLAAIRDRPHAVPPVAELAAGCGYSPDHFARIFRSVTGHGPKEFILKRKMERASALLRESSHTVTQIADLLGYQDLAFFSRQFRDHFGASPARFRRFGAAGG